MNILEARQRTLGKGVYKKTVEGNPAIAQGSLARMYPGIKMQGWTEQDSTDGTNLVDHTQAMPRNKNQSVEIIDGGVKWTGDYYFIISVTGLEKNQTYTMHYVSDDAGSWIFGYTDGTHSSQCLNGHAGTTDPEKDCDKVFIYKSNPTVSGQDMVFTDIMLNAGSTALPYEPYTGGQPSPNPDYPQEITSAGKYDEGTGKYQYEVKLTGKNLFDAEYFRTTLDWKEPADAIGYQYIPIYIGKGNTITISTDGTPAEGLGFYCTIARTNKNTSGNVYTWIYHSINANLIKTNVSFGVIEDDYIYFALNTGHNNIEKFLNAFTNFQIEISAQRTEYQPYKEQTVTLTSDRPLTKWDRLEKRAGVWGWVYKSGSYTMTGNEGFISSGYSYHGEETSNAWIINNDMYSKDDYEEIVRGYCERLRRVYNVWSIDRAVGFTYNKNQIHIRLNNTDTGVTEEDTLTDVANKIKEYVGQQYQEGNPFVFWYETEEETFVPLSETEQEAMNALYTFRPTTVLSNDCECEMTLTYKTKKSLEVAT